MILTATTLRTVTFKFETANDDRQLDETIEHLTRAAEFYRERTTNSEFSSVTYGAIHDAIEVFRRLRGGR